MLKKTVWLCFFTMFFTTANTSIAEKNDTPKITIPLRFHIVSGFDMKKGKLNMSTWVTKADIVNTILPELNITFKQSNIFFVVENVFESRVKNPPNKPQLIDYIVNSRRNSNGKSNPKRVKKLNKLIDWSKHSGSVVNIYFVPYLGETSQGVASPRRKRIFVGQWSDKSSKAKLPPQKFRLKENRKDFRIGSLSRTVAHELGHILGLKHPDKSTQTTFGLLMGGRNPGYILTPPEIRTVREHGTLFPL